MKLILFLLASTLFAGQSIDLSIGSGVASVPTRTSTQSFHIDFQIHDWTLPGAQRELTYDAGLGVQVLVDTTNLLIGNTTGEAPSGYCTLTLLGREDADGNPVTNINVRVTRDYANSQFICDYWNNDGSGYERDIIPIVTPAATTIGNIEFNRLGTMSTMKMGFYRQTLGLPTDSSFPATTYTSATTHSWWKFDNTLTDSSGNARTITWTGTATYSTTPNQGAASRLKTYGAPTWTSWLPFRAGQTGQLDGTASFSMADSSNTVTYFWQQLSGPSTVAWSSRTAAQPTVTGTVFGPYTFQLTVTDAAGSTASDTLEMGAVATDSNGVVVQADANADKIFGPMIGLGHNPWSFQDYQAKSATDLRAAVYATSLPPSWATWKTGTVTYKRSGLSPLSATLNGGISATDTTIVLNDASGFDWSVLPTVIRTSNYFGEAIRICNRSGNTLTVCFDGRGWANSTAAALSNGATVYQMKMTGTGTSFMTTLCPQGTGLAGSSYYSTGTVGVTAGDATVDGSGVTWTSGIVSRSIRIAGTYSTGTPFVFFATIASFTDSDTLELSRVWPAGADTASGLTYTIYNTGENYVAPEWSHPTIATGGATPLISSTIMLSVLCETDTTAYTHYWLEAWGSTQETSRQYAVVTEAFPSDFGLSYYDEGLAHQALYLRSGSQFAYDTAKLLIRWWVWYPGFGGGVTPPRPRQASIISAFADKVLFPDSYNSENWKILRGFASSGAGLATRNNCYDDYRETAYGMSWTALAALFDPDGTSNATWVSSVTDAYNRDNGCKGTGYMNPQYIWPDGPRATGMTATSGSAVVTGTGIASDFCNGAVVGTVTLTNGSTTATLASGGPWQSNKLVVIWGARPDGSPWHLGSTQYAWTSGSSITLSVPYEGTTGTYSFQLGDYDSQNGFNYITLHDTSVALTADAQFGKVFSCTWNSSTQITLDRVWPGSTVTGTLGLGKLNLVGPGQQPFMSGIKTLQMGYGNQTNSSYQTLLEGTANYIFTTGYNPLTLGLYYGSSFPMCDPNWDDLLSCGHNSTSAFGKTESRILGGEAQNAARVHYDANTNDTVKLQLDKLYGGIWGDANYNTGGVYYDSVNAIQTGGYSFASYKWTGFLFGVGMSHQWPAARLGGVAPEDLRTYQYGFTLPSGADKIQLTVLRPNGVTVSPTACTTSPCSFTYDARMGRHLVRHTYQTTGGATRGVSDWREIQ